jgi:phage terminase small subunit
MVPDVQKRKARKSDLENVWKAVEANTTHAFYRNLSLAPDKWPADLKRMYLERLSTLLNLDHVDQEKDCGLCAQVARIETILARLYEYLQSHNLIDEQGKTAPILSILATYENGLRRMYAELGLSPVSRKTLKIRANGESLAILLSREVDDERD